jgi:hypothetical protein
MVVDTVTNVTIDPGYPIVNLTTPKGGEDEEDEVYRHGMVGTPTILFAAVLVAVGVTA